MGILLGVLLCGAVLFGTVLCAVGAGFAWRAKKPFVFGALSAMSGLGALFLLLVCWMENQVSELDEPLVWASQAGDVAGVKDLLRRGANPNARFEDETALEGAHDNQAIRKLLLNAGATE